jgi:Hypothetical glycosyl hydrolase family 15
MRREARHPSVRTGAQSLGRAVALACLALLVLATSASATTDGKLKFIRNATSAFDPQVLAAQTDPALQSFWREHYWRMRGYAPFFDSHTFNGSPPWTPPPTHFYRDLYAIYNNPTGEQTISQHPDWVLRDAAGNKLYLQWACSGTSCTQYAADVGDPGFRQYWINGAASRLAAGYEGIHIDDVNLAMKVSNGAGTFTRPIDPRTGAPMTDADWRRYVAEFTEEIRDAFPDAEIVHNTYWRSHSTMKTDPYALRELAAADTIEVERGFNDAGIVGGTGPYGYETYLAHMDWLHSRGLSIHYEPYGLDVITREFEIASYYLVKDLDDSITSQFQADPSNWSSAWDTNLGAPSSGRFTWNGLFRRDFANGIVLVNQPGETTKTATLPGESQWHDLSGTAVTSVTLGARRGKVLVKGSVGTPPPPPPPPGDTVAPETTILSGPSGTIATTSASFEFSSSEAASRFQCRLDAGGWADCSSPKPYSGLAKGSHTFEVRAIDTAGNVDPSPAARAFQVAKAPSGGGKVTITPERANVRQGARIVLQGTAENAETADISRRSRGRWRRLISDVKVVEGTFRVALRARRPGRRWFRASAPGFAVSTAVRVRVKA